MQVAPIESARAAVERWAVVEPAVDGVEGLPRTRLIRYDIAAQVSELYRELTSA